MADAEWKSIAVNVEFGLLYDAADILAKVFDQIKEVLEIIVASAEAILRLLQAIDDPLIAAIQAAIDELKAQIESWLTDVGAYFLFVPIRKRLQTTFLGLGDITPKFATNLGLFSQPVSPSRWYDENLANFLTQMNRYSGGNAGFFRTIYESMEDAGDLNRPQFTSVDDYVGGIVFIAGTAFDPLGLLDDLFQLSFMFDLETIAGIPRPENLKAYTIKGISTRAHDSEGTFDVFLSWDPPKFPITSLTDLGNIVLFPDRYAVIRVKNDASVLSQHDIMSLTGTRDLSEGDTFAGGRIEVIHEGRYNITTTAYIDRDVPGKVGDSYYYAVLWKLLAFNEKEGPDTSDGHPLGYSQMSNIVRVSPFTTVPPSTPPNWKRTPSIENLLPPLGYFLRKLLTQIEFLEAKLLAASSVWQDFIDVIVSEIEKYEQLIDDVMAAILRLLNMTIPLSKGLYARAFQGWGGNDFFLSDLATSLMSNYPNAPPFHRGDEYVTGAVLLLGGRSVGPVEDVLSLFTNLFGLELPTIDIPGGLGALNEDPELVSRPPVEFDDSMKVTTKSKKTSGNAEYVPFQCHPKKQVTPKFGPDMKVQE